MVPEKRLLPEFRLPTVRGGSAGTRELLPLRELLVARLDGCAECAKVRMLLENRAREGELYGALVFVLSERPPDGAEPHLEELLDAGGRVGAQVAQAVRLSDAPLIAAADRYGVIWSAAPIHGAEPNALIADLAETVHWIGMQCPECGVPTW